MKRLKTTYKPSWAIVGFLCLLVFSSCEIEGEREVCEYNTRLIYRYNRENTTTNNVLPEYIKTLEEYIFDEQGVLLLVNRLPGESCYGKFVSETNLPPGKYTVITWGNDAEPSKVNRNLKGISTRDEMMLYLENPYQTADTIQANSERLYYGYRTFSVNKYGMSRINVDMTHAHCVLDITVRWRKTAEMPIDDGNFYMTIDQIPSEDMFMPEYVSQKEIVGWHDWTKDIYPSQTSEVLHYIPTVLYQEHLVSHRNTMRMNLSRELRGQFISYRYRNDSHELLTIYIAGSPLAGKTMDLNTFFKAMDIDLDRTLRQEYELLLEVDGNRITVSMMTEIDDWNEGGSLGGASQTRVIKQPYVIAY